uniref:P53 domain-containing protein n=1 Tax=Angiostrongylus cantonensis TaxID=6313 RepID=A0A158PBU5_ANGCA
MCEYGVGTSPNTLGRGLAFVNVKCARVSAYKQQIHEVVFIFWRFDLATGRMATRSKRSTSFGFAACEDNSNNQRTQLGNPISNALYGEYAQPAVHQQMDQWMVNTDTRMRQQTFDQTATAKNARTLYCKAEVMVPFMFTFPPNCDSGSHIRVRAEYVEERYINKPVERCPNHLAKDGSDIKMHFLRCEHSQTEYLNSNENYELRIPMCQKTSFMFMCFNSCSGGINRRLIQITFVLEGAYFVKTDVRGLSDYLQKLFYGRFLGQMTQRRKLQRDGNCTSKRMRTQEYPADVTHQIEFHFIDPHKASKCLWFLQNEEKFDQLVCMDIEENPFRDICVPTAGTRIRAWLGKRSIGLASLADEFERHSIFTLGDLARIYRHDIFAGFGFEPDQCAILNKTFYDWYIWNSLISLFLSSKPLIHKFTIVTCPDPIAVCIIVYL